MIRKRGTHVTCMTIWDTEHLSGWFVEHPNVDTSFSSCATHLSTSDTCPNEYRKRSIMSRCRRVSVGLMGLHESVQELRHVGPFCHGRSCVVDTNPHAIYLSRSTIGTPLPSLLVGIKWRYAWLWSIYYVRKNRVLRVHTVARMWPYTRGCWSIFSGTGCTNMLCHF